MKLTLQKWMLAGYALAMQCPAQAGVLADHLGHWSGDIHIPDGRTFTLGAEFFIRADGSAWASVSDISNDNYNIPATRVDEVGNTVNIVLDGATMEMTWVKDHFKGVWKFPGVSDQLELLEVTEFPRKIRAQTPTAPFPYLNETLAIASTDGVTLAATLSIPKEVVKPNLVILVAGSGPQTRDADNFGHQTFAVLADYLARQGIAVLRYDKRGVARSTGDYKDHTLPQLADDLTAIVRTMQSRKQFHHIGLIGHSEGSEVSASVAAAHPDNVAFIVSMAGGGVSGLEMMLLQDRIYAKDQGASTSEVTQIMLYVRKYYETIIAQAEPSTRIAALKALFAELPSADKALIEKYKINVGTLSLAWAEQAFLRVSLMADPSVDWRAIKTPVLAINGSLDHQVPVENLAGILASLKEAGNHKVESTIFPSLNHGFQTEETGAEADPSHIDETIAPVVLQRVANYVNRQR